MSRSMFDVIDRGGASTSLHCNWSPHSEAVPFVLGLCQIRVMSPWRWLPFSNMMPAVSCKHLQQLSVVREASSETYRHSKGVEMPSRNVENMSKWKKASRETPKP